MTTEAKKETPTSSRATDNAMDTLHAALATELSNRIKNGVATSADLAVVAKFLKDNGVSRLLSQEDFPVDEKSPLPSVAESKEQDDEFARISATYTSPFDTSSQVN